MGKLLRFLVLACVVQAAGAQGLFKGFIPDENGTNLDEPQPKKVAPSIASGTIIKDCSDCAEMVVIPAGSFVMGSDKIPDEQPPHTVTVRSFLIGKTEVTQKQWTDIMGSNPSRFTECGQDCPVEQVSWNDAQQFVTKMNQKTGRKYRLPSEAEWEYAARAGTNAYWSFGDDGAKLINYAWHMYNSFDKTQVTGQKLPNAFGLYDMHGNVGEWVQDCWHGTYSGAPTDGSAWTTSCSSDSRVFRGGSRQSYRDSLRSAYRDGYPPDFRNSIGGFRLARDP